VALAGCPERSVKVLVILEAICGAVVGSGVWPPAAGRFAVPVAGRFVLPVAGRLLGVDLPVFAAGGAGFWAAGLAGAAGLRAGPVGFVWAPHASVEKMIKTQRIVDLFSMLLPSMRKILTIDASPKSNFCKITIQNVTSVLLRRRGRQFGRRCGLGHDAMRRRCWLPPPCSRRCTVPRRSAVRCH